MIEVLKCLELIDRNHKSDLCESDQLTASSGSQMGSMSTPTSYCLNLGSSVAVAVTFWRFGFGAKIQIQINPWLNALRGAEVESDLDRIKPRAGVHHEPPWLLVGKRWVFPVCVLHGVEVARLETVQHEDALGMLGAENYRNSEIFLNFSAKSNLNVL